MIKKIKNNISVITGILISIIFIYLGFKNVPFNDLIKYISEINYIYIIPGAALVILGFISRAIRWKILLGDNEKFPLVFNVMMTGFMLNSIMPGRIGEIARPVLMSKKGNTDFSKALSSVAVERIFDLSILLLFFAGLYPFIEIPETLSYKFGEYILNKNLLLSFVSGMTKIGLVLGLGLFLIAFEKTRRLMFLCVDLMEFLSKKISDNFYIKVEKYLSGFLRKFIQGMAEGIKAVKSPGKLLVVVVLSFLAWFFQVLSYYMVARGCSGINLSIPELTFVLIVVSFFIAIPSVPGFWGVWEAGGIFAMSVFQISKTDAAGFNLINHAVQMFPVIIIGLVCAWIAGFSIRNIKEKSL